MKWGQRKEKEHNSFCISPSVSAFMSLAIDRGQIKDMSTLNNSFTVDVWLACRLYSKVWLSNLFNFSCHTDQHKYHLHKSFNSTGLAIIKCMFINCLSNLIRIWSNYSKVKQQNTYDSTLITVYMKEPLMSVI